MLNVLLLLPKEELISSIENGRMCVAVGWPGWYMNDSVNSDYCAFPGMTAPGAESFNSNIYGIWTLGIPSNCKYKESAMKLLKYLTDPDVQRSTIPEGGVPCRYSSLRDKEILEEFPQYEVVCKALEGGVYRPIMEEWSDFYTILGTEMENIMKGDKSMDQGLADAQAKLEEMLSSK